MIRYRWRVLQPGHCVLRPNGNHDLSGDHRCSALLIWPDGERPRPENTLLVDPYFDAPGLAEAEAALAELGLTWRDLGHGLSTHPHWDHVSTLLRQVGLPLRRFTPPDQGPLCGLGLVPTPGHHERQVAVTFAARQGQVWAVGDAVLDREWLLAWGYYYPNEYQPEEVAQTWRSVARVLSGADLVLPGHGPAIEVTADLLRRLLDGFDRAPHADLCPEVRDTLGRRAEALGCGC